MAQRKILLDSCAYLRLAQSVRPLLGTEFGGDRLCLYVIGEFQGEYDGSTRIQTKFPWVQDAEYVENRKKRICLPRASADQLPAVVAAFDSFADLGGLTPSPVDLKGLAVAYLASIEFVTDDRDLAAVANEFGVKVLGSLELLKMMLDAGHVATSAARAACEYMAYIRDTPCDFPRKCQEYFGFDVASPHQTTDPCDVATCEALGTVPGTGPPPAVVPCGKRDAGPAGPAGLESPAGQAQLR